MTGNVTGNVTGDISGDTNVTGILTASSLNVTGNVSIGGTLTYEDVTNIDSVGIITAQSDVPSRQKSQVLLLVYQRSNHLIMLRLIQQSPILLLMFLYMILLRTLMVVHGERNSTHLLV